MQYILTLVSDIFSIPPYLNAKYFNFHPYNPSTTNSHEPPPIFNISKH